MVGTMGTAGGGNDGHIRHFVGRTQGMLRSGILSVIEGSSDIFSGSFAMFNLGLLVHVSACDDTG